jgi:methyl-accepting chemotaxis protein
MTTSKTRDAAARGGRADRGLTGFFRHHGIWAPGVRLFRAVRFTTKSLAISAAFAIPLAALGWGYFGANASSIAFSAAERTGVAYLRALLPALEQAQNQRSAAARGERAAAGSDEALARVQQAHGADLGTASQWKAMLEARAAAVGMPGSASVEQRLAVHGTHVGALGDLMSQVADGSNLTLDPDVDTFYLMDAVTVKGPALIERLAQVGDTALAAAAAGKVSAAQLVRIDRLTNVIESDLPALSRSVGKVVAQRPDLAQPLMIEPSESAVQGLLATSAAGLTPDAAPEALAAVARDARAAVAALRTAQHAQLDALDAALGVRIAGLERSRNMMGALVLATLLLAAYLFHCFYLVTRGGLAEVASHIESMAGGDLTRSPHPWGRDEPAELMVTLASMQKALRVIVAQVRTGSDSIVHASSEIATGALDLSARTEQTAASLEESAASMEEIASTVRATADNARRGAEIAGENATVARRGGEIVEQVVRTMDDIQQASTRIASIVSVIDGIAFQTNILALNAAVEAARAGEQGRGFAVVAGEVRSLSHRSAEAAREIKSLIGETVSKVAAGTAVVRSAGETMQRIVGGADQLTSLSGAIADAAAQQDTGVAQVGEAIQDLDRGAQQNAALVEQTAAAAGSLKDQARALADTVSTFRLPGTVG